MSPEAPADVRAIEEIRRGLEAAENAGDIGYLADVFADDVVMMLPDFPVQNGRNACVGFLGELLPGLLEVFDRRIVYSGSEIRVAGDVAFDRGEFAFTIRLG